MRLRRPDTGFILRRVFALLAALAGCGDDGSTTGEAPATARDTLAAELGGAICAGATSCCASLGHAAPGEACRSSMRNAVMIRIIEAEDDARTLIPERIEDCLRAFERAIAAAMICEELPAPAELLDRCPDLFTPASAIDERERIPPCPHDEDTCGDPPYGARDCPGGRCWTLVFENVCR